MNILNEVDLHFDALSEKLGKNNALASIITAF